MLYAVRYEYMLLWLFVFQTEMLRQFEQQLLLQQMQMKQQEQLEATMKAMNLPQQQHQRGGSKQRQSNVCWNLLCNHILCFQFVNIYSSHIFEASLL